jgi:predicted dehydrogenase
VKVLVAGLGSIGQRHVRNLRQLLGRDVEILAYRVRRLPHVITSHMTLDDSRSVEERYSVRSFDDFNQALAERPDAVLVCNPSSEHMPTALAAARVGCHLLVEKPLADSYEHVDELAATVDRHQRVATIGYQLRFHPALRRLRQLLAEGVIGRTVAVRAEMGEYLPAAHPYEDYRQSYAARAELGGGVIFCFIHEFDYLYWLFGRPRRLFTVGGRLGQLEIDVEDTAHTVMECFVDGRPVPVHVQQSFLQRPASRTCEVMGEAGLIRVDLNAPLLTVMSPDGAIVAREAFGGFERNDLFVDELRHFLDAVAGAHGAAVPIAEAAISLRMALAARESLRTGEAVSLS